MRRALTATGSGPAVVSTFNPITIELILRWKTMPDEVRQQITIDGFAKQNNIKPNYWKRHIRADGQLSDLANAKISKAEGFEYSRITYKIVTLWVNMSQPERDQIKLNGFATQHKINFDRLSRLVTHNGELKHDGKAMKHQALGLKFKPISAAQLISWNNMPKAKRRETSLNDFAEQHEINPMLLKRYIGADGQLKITGKAKIAKAAGEKFQVITPDHINKWRKMCPEVRKQTTMDK